MKTQSFLPIALAALCAARLVAAEPAEDPAAAVELEPVDTESYWRFSAGLRVAPGIKASGAVDARAAAAAAGVAVPAGSGGGRFVRTETLGTTAADARKSADFGGGGTRHEFSNGYIDLDDGSGVEGETQNWHFDSASALSDGRIRAESRYESVVRTIETTIADGLRDSSDETAAGLELRLDRTVWEDEDFGVDLGVGYVWYDDVDCLSVRGRAATVRTTETKESGSVVTTISVPEFSDASDIRNDDGSIGGGYTAGGTLPAGYRIPVLSVSEDRVSTSAGRASRSSRTTQRAVDVRSDGTLSLQELRVGVSPFWKASPVLTLRAGAGLLAVYSELETETVLSVDGAPARTIRADDDDWTFGGYAGAALDLAATDALTFSFGAEARFPHKRLHFDDGVVSGSVGLAEWSAFASVGWRF